MHQGFIKNIGKLRYPIHFDPYYDPFLETKTESPAKLFSTLNPASTAPKPMKSNMDTWVESSMP